MENIILETDTTPLFTRYLYYINDVVISMIFCILKKDIEQSLFWGYELYFSGFQYELIEILLLLYKDFYEIYENNKIKKFIENKANEWKKDNSKDYIIAILIHNILYRDSPIIDLKKGKKSVEKGKKKTIYIIYNNNEIQKYRTIITQYRAYNILRKVCKYSIILNVDSLFLSIECDFIKPFLKRIPKNQLLENYFYHWEYYAFFTPVWKERIQKMGGIPDYINKKIIFQNEELEDMFYEIYGYEPDEQPIEITKSTIGVTF